MRFKIDWAAASLIPVNESKFTIFSLFYFVFEGNFRVQAPQGAYIWRGNLTQGFSRYEFGGLIYLEGLIFGILRYFISNVLSGSFTSHISNSSSFMLQPVKLLGDVKQRKQRVNIGKLGNKRNQKVYDKENAHSFLT